MFLKWMGTNEPPVLLYIIMDDLLAENLVLMDQLKEIISLSRAFFSVLFGDSCHR